MKRRYIIAAFLIGGALSSEAASPHVDFALGVLAKNRGNQAEASDRFEKARIADPTAMPLVQIAIRDKMAAGDRPAAVKLYREIAAARPEELGIQLGYADFL